VLVQEAEGGGRLHKFTKYEKEWLHDKNDYRSL